jgi:hypothetical protein
MALLQKADGIPAVHMHRCGRTCCACSSTRTPWCHCRMGARAWCSNQVRTYFIIIARRPV